jgi:Xaa-Pro aminopeptidase
VSAPPFDSGRLDELLHEDGIDVVIATSRHNTRYLFGEYSTFFRHFDAIGVDRHLPVVGWVRDRPDDAFAVRSIVDQDADIVRPSWVPAVHTAPWTVAECASLMAEILRSRRLQRAVVALEFSFVPSTFVSELLKLETGLTLVDAGPALEELRAVKSAAELDLLRTACEGVVSAIVATMEAGCPAVTTRDLSDRLRIEEEIRGLDFEYCLVTAGASLDRLPGDHRWNEGEMLSMDSGGVADGYIGDLCRMACLGEPTAEMVDLLGEIRAVQDAARRPIKAGAIGGEIYEAALREQSVCTHPTEMRFVAHGVGLVNHEVPRLTATGPVPYPASHRDRALDEGMVISLETHLALPTVGFIKLEDTVAVTSSGYEAFGDRSRDWVAVPY